MFLSYTQYVFYLISFGKGVLLFFGDFFRCCNFIWCRVMCEMRKTKMVNGSVVIMVENDDNGYFF